MCPCNGRVKPNKRPLFLWLSILDRITGAEWTFLLLLETVSEFSFFCFTVGVHPVVLKGDAWLCVTVTHGVAQETLWDQGS